MPGARPDRTALMATRARATLDTRLWRSCPPRSGSGPDRERSRPGPGRVCPGAAATRGLRRGALDRTRSPGPVSRRILSAGSQWRAVVRSEPSPAAARMGAGAEAVHVADRSRARQARRSASRRPFRRPDVRSATVSGRGRVASGAEPFCAVRERAGQSADRVRNHVRSRAPGGRALLRCRRSTGSRSGSARRAIGASTRPAIWSSQ